MPSLSRSLLALSLLLYATTAHATEERKEYKWEFPTLGISGISIKAFVGSIRIDSNRKDQVQIRAIRTVRAKDKNTTQLTLKDTPLTCNNEGGVLVLEDIVPEHLRRERFVEDAPEVELELIVNLPPGMRLSTSLMVGETRISGEAAALTVKSGYGAVRLDNMKVKGGSVIGLDTGDLELSGTFNDLQATLKVGSVKATLDAVQANRVALQTQVGGIVALLRAAPKQSLSASASVGNVLLKVPGNTKGDATVSSQTGKFRSDFSLTRRPRSVGDTGGLLTGTLGRGGTVQIKVTSGVGDAILERG